ncbi:MAG: 5'-3' exonuclease H3TH domain-containing protein [Pseudomonadota bacterium]
MSKLLAIDGLNIVRRIYEANAEEEDPVLKVTTALRHSLSSIHRLLDTIQPTHVLAAFDAGGQTWRHDLFPQYRAHRAPMPPLLREHLPQLFSDLAALGLSVLSIAQVEADDVIATAVMRWLNEARGEAVIASTDKDLHVLIAHGALVWDHFKHEWHDRAWVLNKFGVEPDKLADLLALMGDATDGIPGVSKVGGKTAARLLNAYGNLEGVIAGAGILINPLGARLRNEAKMARLSRQLVDLKTDVALGVTWNGLALRR